MKLRGIAMGFLAALAMTPVVLAQTAKKPAAGKTAPSASVSASASAAPVFKGPAIVRIATEIATGLGNVPTGTLLAVSPLVSDIPAPKGDELANRICGAAERKNRRQDASAAGRALRRARGVGTGGIARLRPARDREGRPSRDGRFVSCRTQRLGTAS